MDYYYDSDRYAVVRNDDNVPGLLITLVKRDQIKSTSKWAEYCNMPIRVDMVVSLEMYSFNKEYKSKVIYLGTMKECLKYYSSYMNMYQKWKEEDK